MNDISMKLPPSTAFASIILHEPSDVLHLVSWSGAQLREGKSAENSREDPIQTLLIALDREKTQRRG